MYKRQVSDFETAKPLICSLINIVIPALCLRSTLTVSYTHLHADIRADALVAVKQLRHPVHGDAGVGRNADDLFFLLGKRADRRDFCQPTELQLLRLDALVQ